MRRTSLIIMVLGMLVALAAPALGAPPSVQHYSMEEQEIEQVSEGLDWYSGHVWHMRGWSTLSEVHAEEGAASHYVSGKVEVVVNWNLNFATGRGNLWGSAHYLSDSPNSGWETTWSGRWTGPGKWSGHGVGSGFGDFEGMKIRYEVENDPGRPGTYMVSGFVFTPGQP